MIKLHIREKGHLIEIPGIPSFRTPAVIDISKGDIRTIVGHLKVCDITDYEIIATNPGGEREKYNAKDFDTNKQKIQKQKPDKKLVNRMDRMEKMIEKLLETSKNDSGKKIEQNINGLDTFRDDVLNAIKDIKISGGSGGSKEERKTIDDEAVAPFIPEFNLDDMKINSQGNTKTVKKDRSDNDSAADALSKLLNK